MNSIDIDEQLQEDTQKDKFLTFFLDQGNIWH